VYIRRQNEVMRTTRYERDHETIESRDQKRKQGRRELEDGKPNKKKMLGRYHHEIGAGSVHLRRDRDKGKSKLKTRTCERGRLTSYRVTGWLNFEKSSHGNDTSRDHNERRPKMRPDERGNITARRYTSEETRTMILVHVEASITSDFGWKRPNRQVRASSRSDSTPG
jgi:hypothetical protein